MNYDLNDYTTELDAETRELYREEYEEWLDSLEKGLDEEIVIYEDKQAA
jgi:hypothetical protein